MKKQIPAIQFTDPIVLAGAHLWMVAQARREYLRLRAVRRLENGPPLRIATPKVANEKFFWRKLFDQNPLFVTVTDKQAAKEWIKTQGIAVNMPETLWVGTDAGEIPDKVWSTPFYIKATHGFGMNIHVVPGKTDRMAIISEANGFMRRSHGRKHKEWAYEHVPHRLIAERSVANRNSLVEIKCFSYGSRVEFYLVLRRRPPQSGARWERKADGGFELSERPTSLGGEVDVLPPPECTERAIRIAEEIGGHFDHVRVDFLSDGVNLFLGELTVYHNAGYVFGQGHVAGALATRSWDIRKSWFLTTPQTGWRKLYADALRRSVTREMAHVRV